MELGEEIDRSTKRLGSHVKAVIGPVWKNSTSTHSQPKPTNPPPRDARRIAVLTNGAPKAYAPLLTRQKIRPPGRPPR